MQNAAIGATDPTVQTGIVHQPAVNTKIADLCNPVAVRLAYQAASARLVELVRGLPDPAARADRLRWTVAETAAHVVGVNRLYVEFAGRQRTPWSVDEIGAYNNHLLAEYVPERDPPALAQLLADAVSAFLSVTAPWSADQLMPWYSGVGLSLASTTAVALGEILVHGRDIARGAGRPWSIKSDEARLVLGGLAPILPLFVNHHTARGVTAAFEIRLRRGGPTFVALFRDGTLNIEPAGAGPVDCHILADPVAYLLVAFGREPQWRAIVQGKLLSWGRKPWIGTQFKGMFRDP